MRKSICSIIISIALSTICHSQSIMPKELLSYPVLIEVKNSGVGTGFFLFNNKKCFLITAHHVLFNITKIRGNQINLLSYPHDPHSGNQNILEINLNKTRIENYVKYDMNYDIVAIEIANADSTLIAYHDFIIKKTPMSALNLIQHSNVRTYDEIYIGNDVYIFGYPTSIGLKNIPQIDYQRPLLRKGIVAGKNISSNTIILDCPSYPGNSGSPVFELEMDYSKLPALGSYWMIGLVSQFVPFVEEWSNDKFGYSNVEISNSGYTVVIPIEKVFELLTSNVTPADH